VSRKENQLILFNCSFETDDDETESDGIDKANKFPPIALESPKTTKANFIPARCSEQKSSGVVALLITRVPTSTQQNCTTKGRGS
jgi:hypothetical protein